MGWVQILIGAIALGREIVKYIQSKESSKAEVVSKIKEFKQGMRRAREEGKTDDIEKMFADLKLPKRK